MMMNYEKMQEIIDAVVAENVYQAWKGWCGSEDKELYYSHEEVITARHMLALGLDECEICKPPTSKNPDKYEPPEL